MRRLAFVKMSGAGNDFILIDASKHKGLSGPALARRLCPRRTSVGADGLLLLRRRGPNGRPVIGYYNADGSRAFCGNGSRCAAAWMRKNGWIGARALLDTAAGPVEAVVSARTRVRMPDARVLGRSGAAWRVVCGVPHAVVFVRGLERFPVVAKGRPLRRRLGANVDFAQISGRGLRLRTYERGVEDETLACGTGAVAAAVAAAAALGLKSPIAVAARGGTLEVSFETTGPGRFSRVWLEGPAVETYRGEVVL